MSRVITVRDLEHLLSEQTAEPLILNPGDVISPSALDAAKQRGIRIVRNGSEPLDRSGRDGAGLADALQRRIAGEVNSVIREHPDAQTSEIIDRTLHRLAAAPRHESEGTVTERLAAFINGWAARGVPGDVRHEVKRAILNSLGASLAAHNHPVAQIFEEWVGGEGIACAQPGHCRMAPVLWTGTTTLSEHAAMLGAAQMHVLDFDDTHIDTYSHPTPQVFASALAEASVVGASGRRLIDATAIGMEVQLAIATMLFPSHYMQGFHITSTIGSAGAAAGCAVVHGLDVAATVNALGIAMLSSGGLIEAVGTMSNAYDVGAAARSGAVAAQLAAQGLVSARTAYEGDKGLMAATSSESIARAEDVLSDLGSTWKILTANSYKYFPTETITQAPLEALLAVRRRTSSEKIDKIRRLHFAVEPIVAEVCRTRPARWGGVPQTPIQAKFDLRYCVAAAWVRGRFTHEELATSAVRDPSIIGLRERVIVEPDESVLLQGTRLEVEFDDGSTDSETVPAFTGSAVNPMTDEQLEEKFQTAAEGRLSPGRTSEILATLWRLDEIDDIESFARTLVVDRG